MNPDIVTTLAAYIWALDYGSVLVFALTGALVASRQQLDITGFIFMAALTAVGGGTLRDLVLGRDPVFWVERPGLIVTAAVAAFIVYWAAPFLESRYRWLLWLDAIALGVAVPAGVGVAFATGYGPIIVVICGVITACMGGLIRDVVGNEVPLILKGSELYLTAAFGGALAGLLLVWLGLPRPMALIGCGLATFVLRAGAMIWGWSLPAYRPRPPRNFG
ncbi:trimeric intracellular cation channel family protein [Paracoccus xiamenensis]|uniref:trimeric intracellular cation channel family protein n=1 Tax=Paracoccus xiamenensis TaxID=2714901 RepID=UPI001407A3E2|nr:trimeric intracellular cation channel family protein [Paracoccus xiamenensis]NHF72698.1 trimeric intracellular cation channel family protein [Paracoccus xiamenensis]